MVNSTEEDDENASQELQYPESLLKDRFSEYKDIDNEHKISINDLRLFGNRSPEGYEKVRLVTKL